MDAEGLRRYRLNLSSSKSEEPNTASAVTKPKRISGRSFARISRTLVMHCSSSVPLPLPVAPYHVCSSLGPFLVCLYHHFPNSPPLNCCQRKLETGSITTSRILGLRTFSHTVSYRNILALLIQSSKWPVYKNSASCTYIYYLPVDRGTIE